MQEETIDPRELNPLALAFVGDSVLEMLVRTLLAQHHRLSAGKLNTEKVKYVSARAQCREEQLLEPRAILPDGGTPPSAPPFRTVPPSAPAHR